MEKLAQCVGITGSQMSRIINGKTLKVSHELVIAIAAEFDVSTDFLLGLTSIPDRTRLDELGLSEKAIRNACQIYSFLLVPLCMLGSWGVREV